MAQWISVLWNNSFVNPLINFAVYNSGAIHLVQQGLMTCRQAGSQMKILCIVSEILKFCNLIIIYAKAILIDL